MGTTTITIRARAGLRRELTRRAAARGKSMSEVVREILEEAVSGPALADRAGHLRGSLELPREGAQAWRDRLRKHNWRS
jgi:plasmid stability protein